MKTKARGKVWWRYRPPAGRDLWHLTRCPGLEHYERERDYRVKLLATSACPDHRQLARILASAHGGQPAGTTACPISAALFQRFAVSRVLAAIRRYAEVWFVTLVDEDADISLDELTNLSWPTRHARVRRRIVRAVGRHALVVGVGELDWSETDSVFRVHHHLMIANASRREVEGLRRFYRRNRSMKVQRLAAPARQVAYMLKFCAYRKAPFRSMAGKAKNQRLRPPELRAHLAHLSRHEFTDFVFCQNFRLSEQPAVHGDERQIRSNRLVPGANPQGRRPIRRKGRHNCTPGGGTEKSSVVAKEVGQVGRSRWPA